MSGAWGDLARLVLGIIVTVIGATGHSYVGGWFWKVVTGLGLLLWIGGIY